MVWKIIIDLLCVIINVFWINENMIEYYPWSKEVLDESLKIHDGGGLPTLDIELTAKCSKASCIYCDSKPAVGNENPNELKPEETEKLVRDAADMGLRWVYTCGLGEPFEDRKFTGLVSLLHKLDVRISLFTNGIFIDRKKADWLHEHGVCLILKLDTFDEAVFDEILGIEKNCKKSLSSIGPSSRSRVWKQQKQH